MQVLKERPWACKEVWNEERQEIMEGERDKEWEFCMEGRQDWEKSTLVLGYNDNGRWAKISKCVK